ncbi:hypothetical protein LZ198_41975 [Myxococcus sp. K15C18031901]|uniref:hypothetical protein n=1 Tax=Myxococcus dinghuensis TaxID=2906761 RepID=UPI0020A815C7|nr:hypothetical protein [Myxococcus dinghuensis]MCP3105450.1 hypothetical protein [Myxococcus dinghuensis]
MLLAEVPLLADGELPADLFDRDRYEFTGLAGVLPDDLRAIIAEGFPPGTLLSRVQLRLGAPRPSVSLTLTLMPLLLLCFMRSRARDYERSEDARMGYPQRVSWFFILLGLPLPLSVVWQRSWLNPEADSIGLVVGAFSWLFFWLLFAFALRGRRQWDGDISLEEAPVVNADGRSATTGESTPG